MYVYVRYALYRLNRLNRWTKAHFMVIYAFSFFDYDELKKELKTMENRISLSQRYGER